MISKAYIMRGIGDALNARDFLISYCQQKNIKQQDITVYTSLHQNIFEDTKFKIKPDYEVNINNLTSYANFGHFDLEKKYKSLRYDFCIAKNADINYDFNKIYPLNWVSDISNIKLPERYITINTGHDNNSNPMMICKKMWSINYWNELVKNIGIDVVQVGAGWSCKKVDGVKLNLVDKLSLKQSAEVMKKALFHIDIEGGLVILNQHINVKSVVLFGATEIEHFAREGNLNLRNTTCYACSGSLDTQRQRNTPLYVYKLTCNNKCMLDLKPSYVIEQIKKYKWI